MSIGFVGAGQMARALAYAMIKTKLVAENSVYVFDPNQQAIDTFCQSVGSVQVVGDNEKIANSVKTIILAVKPQIIPNALNQLKDSLTEQHLLISIAAGITTQKIDDLTAGKSRIIRVMPNTPCLVGQSASAYCLGPRATAQDSQSVEQMLTAVGKVFQLPENMMDAVTGLSGSGPAFIYLIIEALSDAGVKVGLPREIASQLSAQTVLGAAQMVLTTGEHPSILKDNVTSPGGTTIAGLQKMEEGAVRATMIQAVQAATARSVELGNQ